MDTNELEDKCMASIIKVDQIKNSNGETVLDDGYPTQPGQIIECLSSPCDGSTVTGLSGSYTWPSVSTSGQLLPTSYTDASGSVISYTPPAGTSKVVYRYTAMLAWNDDHAISHWRLYIDDQEVVYARANRSGRYPEDKTPFEWTFNIGGTADANTGRQSSWNTAKTIKWQVRDYSSNNQRYRLHLTQYWDGGGTDMFSMPMLTIMAIA